MKYCCNPFKEPSHKANSTDLAAKALQIGIHLTAEISYICDTCRLDLKRRLDAHINAQLEIAERERQQGVDQDAQREVRGEAQRAQRVQREHQREEQREIEREAQRKREKQAKIIRDPRLHRRSQRVATQTIAAQEQKGEAMDVDLAMDVVLGEVQIEEHSKPAGSSSESEVVLEKAAFVDKFNKLLPLIGVNKIIFEKIGRSQSYMRNKLDEITRQLAKTLFEIPLCTDAGEQNAEQEMLQQLKDEFFKTDRRDVHTQILSVLPRSWSARKVAKEFNTSVHFALHTKKIVDQHGILCDAEKRMGTTILPDARVKIIEDFFTQDNVSQPCPGKNDCVTVRLNDEKVKLQKRLLLMNLKEAHCQFKLKYPNEKVGFSKFASLRPKQCITALETGGTHYTCVCCHHQNVKLVFDSVNKYFKLESYRDLFDKYTCAEKSQKCHLNECYDCPGATAVMDFVRQIMEENVIENVMYKQWRNNESGKN